ncbi:MAG: deoxyguanosinetriphosphate triphosphohydrolase [Bacillota bacterium]
MRQDWQKWEDQYLSPYAARSSRSLGRLKPEEPCPIRTAYQKDRDKIIHSKAFRRLKHKTQVFIAPKGDHFRTRLTHVLEVSQIARTIARALCLNEDLTEAIALGHDLGHTPFGHAGERALATLYPGFSHNKQSLRVVDCLERGGRGLNLTYEVRDGILNHCGEGVPATLEGKIVRISDRIAYITHDIDDAIRAGLISEDELPLSATAVLGKTHSINIDTMVLDIINNSMNRNDIEMSPKVTEAMNDLRNYLFNKVYFRPHALKEEQKLSRKLVDFYNYYLQNTDALPKEYICQPLTVAVCDYIAGMTDNFALEEHDRIFG